MPDSFSTFLCTGLHFRDLQSDIQEVILDAINTITVQFKKHCSMRPSNRCAFIPASQINGPLATPKAPGGTRTGEAPSWHGRPPAQGSGLCYIINPRLRGAAQPSQAARLSGDAAGRAHIKGHVFLILQDEFGSVRNDVFSI